MQIFNCDDNDKFNALKEQYELTILYDYYSGLLKESQREILADYYFNDMSLSEIADERGISRQGVHDTVKRCSKSLMEFEEIMGLATKQKSIKKCIKLINNELGHLREDVDSKESTINRIEEVLNEIKDYI